MQAVQSRGHINSLDAVRAFAAICVMLFHVTGAAFKNQFGVEPVGNAFSFGYCGLDAFFVLSGFVIYYIHWRDIGDRKALPQYAWKRLTRIYPAYWLITAAYLSLAVLSHATPSVTRIWHSFVLFPGDDLLLGVAWTLPHELLFYGVFALALISPRLAIVTGAVLLVGIIFFFGSENKLLHFLFEPRHFEFGLGIIVARLVQMKASVVAAYTALAIGSAIFAGSVAVNVSAVGIQPVILVATYGMSSGAIIYAAVKLESVGRLVVPAPVKLLGEASYSIYLVHTLAFSLVVRALKLVHVERLVSAPVLLCLVIGAVLASGLMFHKLVERPLLDLCRRFLPFRRPSQDERRLATPSPVSP